MTDATRVPLHLVAAAANRHDAPVLGPTLTGLDTLGPRPAEVTVHLDRGYDRGVVRALLDAMGVIGVIACRGVPAPVQVGSRWVVVRTHAWMNGYGTLRRMMAPLGTPMVVGSTQMGVMVWRDMDLNVLCPELDPARIWATIRPLASHPLGRKLR